MKSKNSVKISIVKIVFALIVGFINGFFGGGGGLLCVPTLKKIYKLDTKTAHATAISIMFPLSVVSSVIYLLNNKLQIDKTLIISLGVVVGGFLGSILLKKLSSSFIRWVFIIILFTSGIKMIV